MPDPRRGRPAVAAEDALVVPTIFDADRKSIDQIGREPPGPTARVRMWEATLPIDASLMTLALSCDHRILYGRPPNFSARSVTCSSGQLSGGSFNCRRP